ncbi:MAG: hypothetical protein P1Q69_20990, partial [Candidatus Thorarchaeota archaeon]|nr:hypothetical protein [Candidatus Thorarchaeota archaeon]
MHSLCIRNQQIFQPQLAISEPVLIFSVVSSIITILVFSYAILLLSKGKKKILSIDESIVTKGG